MVLNTTITLILFRPAASYGFSRDLTGSGLSKKNGVTNVVRSHEPY